MQQAQATLLAPEGLLSDSLAQLLASVAGANTDFADVYLQHSRHEGWVLENGIVRNASFNLERGAGVRVISGEQTGFAYTDDLSLDALRKVAQAAGGIARQGQTGALPMLTAQHAKPLYSGRDPITQWAAEQKVALLQRLDRS